jgi:hypothetical protein
MGIASLMAVLAQPLKLLRPSPCSNTSPSMTGGGFDYESDHNLSASDCFIGFAPCIKDIRILHYTYRSNLTCAEHRPLDSNDFHIMLTLEGLTLEGLASGAR